MTRRRSHVAGERLTESALACGAASRAVLSVAAAKRRKNKARGVSPG